jgi:hypothetical protein
MDKALRLEVKRRKTSLTSNALRSILIWSE